MNPHYFSEEQTSPLKLNSIKSNLRNHKFEFISAGGVFSSQAVDKGTELLIHSCIIQDGWDVLDLGCGYGPVGISIAKAFPKTRVTMVDINRRAIDLATDNVKNNKVGNAVVLFSNLYDELKGGLFDTILTNPPQTAGRAVCNRIIEEAPLHLKPGGLLQLVARHNKGGETLSKKMQEVFGNAKTISKKSGYRVYVSNLEPVK